MNFFQNIAQTGINNVMIQIIQAENGQTTVFVTPKSTAKDEALKLLKPITLTGTPEELDFEFFQIITKPLEAAQQLFTNIESFEAQLAEAAKATADKKKDKAKATSKKEEASEEDGEETEVVEKPKAPAKEVKVDNIKPLKEFYDSIKGQDILLHQEKIDELYSKLTQTELDKPYPKKVRLDLDIALRKQAQIQAAKDKMRGITPKEEHPAIIPSVPEPSAIEKIVEERNKNISGKGGAEEEQSEESEAHELTQEEINEVMTVLTDDFPTQEEEVEAKPVPVVSIAPTPVPAPAPIPVPEPMPTTVIEEVPELAMLVNDYTYEQYLGAGWTDELLIQHGKAKIMMVVKEIPVTPAPAPMAVPTPAAPTGKLSYTFPKPFDADNAGGTGHGDISHSDADSGL